MSWTKNLLNANGTIYILKKFSPGWHRDKNTIALQAQVIHRDPIISAKCLQKNSAASWLASL